MSIILLIWNDWTDLPAWMHVTVCIPGGSTLKQLCGRKCWWFNDKKGQSCPSHHICKSLLFPFLLVKYFSWPFFIYSLSSRISLVIPDLSYSTETGFIILRRPHVRKELPWLFGHAYHSISSQPSRQGIQHGSYDLPGHLTAPAISVCPAETTRLKIIQLSNNSMCWISAEQMVKYPPFIIN